MKPLILTPGFEDNAPTATLYYGQDVRKSLRLLPDASVNTVCTSPPYWGLRNYGDEKEQVGIEGSPQEFAETLVEVFREIKRVLRTDGTVWLNLGDSYCGTGHKGDHTDPKHKDGRNGQKVALNNKIKGLKSKDLVGIPWRVALALQDDGWYLRSDIIWAKSNPMPESVRDRPTKSHEYVFLLAHPDSGGKYYYDQDAIKERCSGATIEDFKRRKTLDNKGKGKGTYEEALPDLCRGRDAYVPDDFMRNKRTVWALSTKPYPGSHFATWPPELARPMVLAGCPKGGVVLDPFSGSATTGMVALQEGRNYIGIDLHADYLDLATARLEGRRAPKTPEPSTDPNIFDLFGGGM